MVKLDEAQATVKATVATALAKALICGINECEENDHPLSELQMIDMAKYSIMNYDQAIEAAFFEELKGGDN